MKTTVKYLVATPNRSMVHPKVFTTPEDAFVHLDLNFNNRSKGDGFDSYWRSKGFVVLKVTEHVEIMEPPKREPILITHDGVPIFEGDSWWYVTPNSNVPKETNTLTYNGKNVVDKLVIARFYDLGAAHAYIRKRNSNR